MSTDNETSEEEMWRLYQERGKVDTVAAVVLALFFALVVSTMAVVIATRMVSPPVKAMELRPAECNALCQLGHDRRG